MAKKKKIGAFISLDGEKEFRSAVSSCNKSLSTMKSEMKLVEAQTAGSANSLSTLQKKHDVLTETLEEHVKKESLVRDGLKHAEEEYGRVGKELETYRGKLESAEKALEEMQQSSETTEEALNSQAEQVKQLQSIVSKGEETYQRAGNRVQDWKKQLNNAEAQTIRATKALNENDAYLREAEQSFDQCATSINKFGKEADDTAEKLTEFGTVLETNLKNTVVEAGKSLSKDIFQGAVEGAMELQDAQRQLQASTGATAKATGAYNKQMQDLYTSGYGDAVESVANAMALVKQYTNETDPGKIKELAENAITLEDVFGMDMSESIRGIDALMTNMGLDAEEAFDYVAKGAQNGLDKSGELTDNLAEYSQLWSQAGFSAEEMFTILQNGLDSGAYNLDKVNDFVKEFGISLADGRIGDNINAFSNETKQLFQEWQSGHASTEQVFKSVITDLGNMENRQQALTIASNTWSALGEDNAMNIITSLNNVNTTYKDVQGTMEEIKEIKYDSVSNQWKVLGRTFQNEVAAPMLKTFLPAAQTGMKLVAENIKGVTVVAGTAGTAITAMFVKKKSKELIKDLKDTASGISNVVKKIVTHTTARTAETVAENASAAAKVADTTAETANTAATVAGTAATATGTASTTAGTAATIAHTVATESATIAQTAFNVAMEANPAGLLLVGITATLGAIAAFSGQIETAKTKTDELTESTEKNISKISEVTENLEKSADSWNESLGKIEAKEGVADNLVTELYHLEAQGNKTDEEISRMNSIVSQLNSMFPELSLSVNQNTGALNKNEQQTRQSIEAALQLSKASAAQKKMTEISEDLVDAEMAKYEAERNLKKIGDELSNLDEQRTEITKKSSEATKEGANAYVEYNGKMIDAQEALRQIAESEDTLTQTQKNQQDALDGLVSKYQEADEQYQSAYEYTQNLTQGTNANTEAVQGNTDAKNANSDADATKQEASTASIEVLGQEQEAYNNLSAAQQQLAVDVTNGVLAMYESVTGVLESQMNMFEQFDGGVELSTQELLANMQSQVDGVEQWEQNMAILADRGINQNLLQKLADMGPEGAGYVQTFVNMSDDEISKANALWSQSIDIKGMTNQWGKDLLESGASSIAGGMDNLQPLLQESGANSAIGLVLGMQNAQKTVSAAGSDLGVKTIDSINEGLGVQSPSKKTKESGRYVGEGLVLGMNSALNKVELQAALISRRVIRTVRDDLTEEKFTGYGANVSEGLASGIKSGKSKVINAVSEVCKSAVREAKSELQIHSPSKVFKRLGGYTAEGFGLGYQEKMSDVNQMIRESIGIPKTNQGQQYVSDGVSQRKGDSVIQIPIYVNGVYKKTEIIDTAVNGIGQMGQNYMRAKGKRINVG